MVNMANYTRECGITQVCADGLMAKSRTCCYPELPRNTC